jgi:YcxB-like protein
MYGKLPSTIAGYILIIAIGLIPLIGFALWPMIKFKPQTRTLTVNESGIETSVGDKKGKVSWNEFIYFKREPGLIVLQRRNLNSFLVPSRAFKTENDEEEFQSFVSKKINESGV